MMILIAIICLIEQILANIKNFEEQTMGTFQWAPLLGLQKFHS